MSSTIFFWFLKLQWFSIDKIIGVCLYPILTWKRLISANTELNVIFDVAVKP